MISIAALALAASTYYAPAEAQAMTGDAARAATHGQWADAAAEYRKLVDHGLGSADVLYNLGTAELHLDRPADAARDLERARAAGAAGDDVDANLALARRRASLPGDRPLAAFTARRRLVDRAAWTMAALWALALALVSATRVRQLQ